MLVCVECLSGMVVRFIVSTYHLQPFLTSGNRRMLASDGIDWQPRVVLFRVGRRVRIGRKVLYLDEDTGIFKRT